MGPVRRHYYRNRLRYTADMNDRIVATGTIDPKQILANPLNWRLHSRLQQTALAGLLKDLGWISGVLINRTTGLLIDGHLRVRIARAQKIKEIPVDFVELSAEEETKALATYDGVAALAEVEKNGRFDVVVCDSVINSVDTVEAEQDVMICLNAFCKPGGRIHFSCRNRDGREKHLKRTVCQSSRSHEVEFMDDDGFSGILREGVWFYQKFNTLDYGKELCRKYLGDPTHERCDGGYWKLTADKQYELDWEMVASSLNREFNLPWTDGASVDRGAIAVETVRAAIMKEKHNRIPDAATRV